MCTQTRRAQVRATLWIVQTFGEKLWGLLRERTGDMAASFIEVVINEVCDAESCPFMVVWVCLKIQRGQHERRRCTVKRTQDSHSRKPKEEGKQGAVRGILETSSPVLRLWLFPAPPLAMYHQMDFPPISSHSNLHSREHARPAPCHHEGVQLSASETMVSVGNWALMGPGRHEARPTRCLKARSSRCLASGAADGAPGDPGTWCPSSPWPAGDCCGGAAAVRTPGPSRGRRARRGKI